MNFIDSLSATIYQLTRLIHRLEHFIEQMLNLTVDEMNNAIEAIQNHISDIRQDGLGIMSTLDPVSLRHSAGYWTRSGLRRRWLSYRGRSKRGGRRHRGWAQRRYPWRSHHYQQEHNYSQMSRNEPINVNIRSDNVLMLMPATQEAVLDVLPLVQPVSWPTEPSAPVIAEPSAAQAMFSEPLVPQPEVPQSATTFTHPSFINPPIRLVSQRTRAQPILTHCSVTEPFFSQLSRQARRAARPLHRPQSVRLHQPSAMSEPHRRVYRPVRVQSRRVRVVSSTSGTRRPNGLVAPAQGAPSVVVHQPEPMVLVPLEPEQVVPLAMIDPASDYASFEYD